MHGHVNGKFGRTTPLVSWQGILSLRAIGRVNALRIRLGSTFERLQPRSRHWPNLSPSPVRARVDGGSRGGHRSSNPVSEKDSLIAHDMGCLQQLSR